MRLRKNTNKRSYRAMFMSMVIPGLGQCYLGRRFEGAILFIGVVFAALLIYGNSYPVTGWDDLTRLESDPEFIHIVTIRGTQLMFRPMWEFKVSGWIQGLLFWFYAVFDGWRGQREFNRQTDKRQRPPAKKPSGVQQREEAIPTPKVVESTRGYDKALSIHR